jgi:methylenetetrahydrofolate--tRNA-(uracil-5-)-methyltransferase
MEIVVVGGGLAGCEAAYQIACLGTNVTLYEMRPESSTPAHKTGLLAELVCSNSLKSQELTNAHGLLKEELRRLDSPILRMAYETAIPGGKALVVDRNRFAAGIEKEIESNGHIRIVRKEVTQLPAEGIVLVATGPLTSQSLTEDLCRLTGTQNLFFFDAISPIIDAETIDREHAFFGSRYLHNSDDYLNCPLSRKEYDLFYDELLHGSTVSLRDFEKTAYFEGCLPVEIMASRGRDTLLFGPMKPVGLIDPRTGSEPYAVIQLRREDESGTMYNMVGFQTKLTYGEQERVFGLVPALRGATFLRYGSIHRNTYVNGPAILDKRLRLKGNERILLAGQITGVEGYVESAAMGLLAGISAALAAAGREFHPPPETTCLGALAAYITTERKDFQPMNMNFGLLKGYHKRQKERVARDALKAIEDWRESGYEQGATERGRTAIDPPTAVTDQTEEPWIQE